MQGFGDIDDVLDLDAATPVKRPANQTRQPSHLEPSYQDVPPSSQIPASIPPVDHPSSTSPHKPSESIHKTPVRPALEGRSGSPYPNTVPSRVHEELLTKYKLMEARRSEDKEKLRELEKLKEDNENWSNVVKPKMQSKLNECLEEIKSLKKLVRLTFPAKSAFTRFSH
jgi:dynactin 1